MSQYIYMPSNVNIFSGTQISFLPAPRFATTMEHYCIKKWNPRDLFFPQTPSVQYLLVGPRGEPLPWDSKRAAKILHFFLSLPCSLFNTHLFPIVNDSILSEPYVYGILQKVQSSFAKDAAYLK